MEQIKGGKGFNMQPIDYTLPATDTFGHMTRGFNTGLQTVGAIKQQQAQQERQRAMQADIGALMKTSTPTAKSYVDLMLKYPEMSDQLKQGWDLLEKEQQSARINEGASVYSALHAGRYDVAKQTLQDKADAYRNSGDMTQAKQYETMIDLITSAPEVAKHSAGMLLAATMGKDEFIKTFSGLREEERAARSEPYDLAAKATEAQYSPDIQKAKIAREIAGIRDIDSKIYERAARLGLDRDKLNIDAANKIETLRTQAGKLSTTAEKVINDAAVSSITSEASANNMERLADRVVAARASGELSEGVFGSIENLVGTFFGSQDEVSAIRTEYKRLVNEQVINNLPPGVASDRDIQFAREGFFSANTNAEQLAAGLRGMAKLARWKAATDDVRSQWAAETGHLGKARKDISVSGMVVPAGTTLQQFMRDKGGEIYDAINEDQQQKRIKERSYMGY